MKEMVGKYIEMLTPEHIKVFASSEGVYITDQEVMLIYGTIKEHGLEIINGNTQYILNLEDKVSPPVYNKVWELIKRYQAFL